MKNIVGDILQNHLLDGAHISLMDIDSKRLEESGIVLDKIIKSLNVKADFSLHTNQERRNFWRAEFCHYCISNWWL